MRMRALFRTGLRLSAGSGLLSLATGIAGVQAPWLRWALALACLAGITDMVIAAMFNVASCARVAVDEIGLHFWLGGDAQEERRLYLEGRAGRGHLADGAFQGMSAPGTGLLEACALNQRARLPEKRLLPPLVSFLAGERIEFPERPAYSLRDRLGVPQPPFPVHFTAVGASETQAAGARMSHSVMEAHSDPHEGCPVCDSWRAVHDR